MKLIIDIPNKDYEFIKNLQSLIIGCRGNTKTIQYNVINAIKNGIHYESEMTMPIKEDTHKSYWESVGSVEYGEEGKIDLCKTCRKGDVCARSTKIFHKCYTSKCSKYEEADNG